MASRATRAEQIYKTFRKLNSRNSIKKRGAVVCHESDEYYTPEKAVSNFYNAILKVEEQTALERVILVALEDLSSRQVRALGERLKALYLEEHTASVV